MIRIATIGTGVIVTTFAEAVERVEGIRIHAVFSRDSERGAALAERVGAASVFTSLDDLLAASDIDAVYIASPNSVHLEQARAAIRAGKHVLVEKPAVLRAEEWMLLVDEAREAGVVLLEAMRTAYDPGLAAVRRLLSELGTIRRASFRYDSRSARYDRVLAGEQVNIFDPALGGGALRDLGVYGVHAMVTLFGAPESVSGEAVLVKSGVEGAGVVVARYPGLVVDISYSKIGRSALGSEIQGEEATLSIDHVASPRRLVLHTATGSREVDVAGPAHTLDGEVQRFVHLVLTGESSAVDAERTLQTLQILEQVLADETA